MVTYHATMLWHQIQWKKSGRTKSVHCWNIRANDMASYGQYLVCRECSAAVKKGIFGYHVASSPPHSRRLTEHSHSRVEERFTSCQHSFSTQNATQPNENVEYEIARAIALVYVPEETRMILYNLRALAMSNSHLTFLLYCLIASQQQQQKTHTTSSTS